MVLPAIPHDDLPPPSLTPLDTLLRWRLEEMMRKYFYEQCDRITQALLSECQWGLTSDADALLLTVFCPNVESYWHLVSAIEPLGRAVRRLGTDQALIRIISPLKSGRSLEMRVDELLERSGDF